MIIETQTYKVLAADDQLNSLFDKFRGKPFGHKFQQGIFTYDIPETPINLKKKELAPFMRINSLYDNPDTYCDDEILSSEQRVKIEYWCKSAKESEAITERIDQIMKDNGFERYTANETPRYKDNDIDLIMNVRKYRYFYFN